jgi:DNA-binding response OmpR family regulator
MIWSANRKMYGNILIVEDELPLRKIISRNLTSRGHSVREASTVEEALAALRDQLPDLLLLDINLPDRTGWDVLRDLRQRGVEVPTVIVSAVRVSQNRLAEFRPLAYLPKPFPLEAMLQLVEQNETTPKGEQRQEYEHQPS